jgi:hypothetical protein
MRTIRPPATRRCPCPRARGSSHRVLSSFALLGAYWPSFMASTLRTIWLGVRIGEERPLWEDEPRLAKRARTSGTPIPCESEEKADHPLSA